MRLPRCISLVIQTSNETESKEYETRYIDLRLATNRLTDHETNCGPNSDFRLFAHEEKIAGESRTVMGDSRIDEQNGEDWNSKISQPNDSNLLNLFSGVIIRRLRSLPCEVYARTPADDRIARLEKTNPIRRVGSELVSVYEQLRSTVNSIERTAASRRGRTVIWARCFGVSGENGRIARTEEMRRFAGFKEDFWE